MKLNHKGVWMGVVLIVFSFFGLAFLWRLIPYDLPWFYSLAWGEKQLINKYWFGGGLGVLSLVFVIDVFLAGWLKRKDEILGDVVIWFSVGMVSVYLASFWRVIMIVI